MTLSNYLRNDFETFSENTIRSIIISQDLAVVNHGPCSDYSEELAYYDKIRKEMDYIKKRKFKKVYPFIGIIPKKWINESEYFFIN